MNRRHFLQLSAAGVAAAWFPAFAQAPASRFRNLLVLVELKGGNDGLNTVIPFADPLYGQLRPRIAIERDAVLKLTEQTGLHPSLQPLMPTWESKQLAIVQGVGYAEPNLSHFRSIEIWDTASEPNQYVDEGWLTRVFAKSAPPSAFAADGVIVGSSDLGPLAGHGARAIALADPAQFTRQARLAKASVAHRNPAIEHILKVERDIVDSAAKLVGTREFKTEFPRNGLGNAVRVASQLAANPAGVAAIRVSLGSFDTHANQQNPHANLLKEFAESMVALKSALQEIGRWDSTLVMTYSEFGRRPKENLSAGTDHGTVAPHFLMGGLVKGGLYGDAPQLNQLDGSGNLRYAVDYRSLYATVLRKWWSVDPKLLLDKEYKTLDLLRT